ncbi:ubiquinol-cytochrome c reductase cytochrome b subunit [Thermoflexales bacterium]|nr:ubiquinol-cytochrome c reductase cytochrome b subunit [Thermoflexales bacterium]
MPGQRPNFFYHLHPPTIPKREGSFRYTFGLGGISVLLFLVLAVTGLLLTFFYIPTPDQAADSIQIITYQVPFGWLVRNLHYWAAQWMVIVVALHLLRVIFTGAYKLPRRTNYIIGLVLLVGTLLLDFTGYVLRWDAGTHWALVVGTNLIKDLPVLGPALYQLIVGGSQIGGATTIRFYGWHLFGLTIPALILIVWHSFKVRRDGGISHQPRLGDHTPRLDRAQLVKTETVVALLVLAALIFISIVLPAPIGPVADLPLPAEAAQAPWFFLWVQALLRSLPPFVAGIFIPIGVLALLLVIPYWVDRRKDGVAVWFNRPGRVAQIITIVIFVGLIALTLVELGQ